MVALAAGLIQFSQTAGAACTTAGSVANCTGVMSADVPVSYNAAAVSGVAVTNIDTITVTSDSLPHFSQHNSSSTEDHDIAINFNSGTLTTAVNSFIFWIRNLGTGTTDVTVSGQMYGGGVRAQSNLADNTDPNTVLVNASGVIETPVQTAVWLRDQSQGASTIDIYGTLTSGHSRGVHLSNNNADDMTLTAITVYPGGSVTSGNQGVYVGNVGRGDTMVQVDDQIIGGVDDDALNTFDDYSAGVVLDATKGSATLTIGASGAVSSLNDLAIVDTRSRAAEAGGVTSIVNSGLITGFLLLGEGDDTYANVDSLENTGTVLLRDFADDDFDGIRDTESEAVIDFGAADDTFVNTGSLILASVDSATTPGIESGLVSGLESFSAGGTISLQDVDGGGATPVAGDTLTITGGTTVTEAAELKLDVTLGDDASLADKLILDDVAVGSGPINIVVANAGGLGALTTGLGILVVEVTGTSPAAAFAMSPVSVNGFLYELVQADGQNWYLQSTAVAESAASADASPVPALPLPLLGLMSLALLGLGRSAIEHRQLQL